MTGERDELIARLEALSGPDREVDLALARHLVPDVIVLRYDSVTKRNEAYTHWQYTESIDAAVALVERVKPIGTGPGKWHWYVDDRSAAVWPDGIYDESAVQAVNPAIALCLALIRSTTESDK